jgi:hypothetical protein
MRRIISIVGLCLAAVFAFSAMAASSASAGELLALIAPKGGSAAGVSFLSKAELPLLITHNNTRIHCKDAINFGHFLTSSLGDILIQFLGCTSSVGSCRSLGAAAGEIHLPLATTLFHLGLAHLTSTVGKIPAVLILLDKDVHIECGEPPLAALILVLGAVIGALRLDKEGNHGPLPLNTPVLQALLAFEQTANGLQHLRLFLLGGSLASYDLDASINGAAAELASEVANTLLFHFLLPNGKENDIEFVEDQ